MTPPYSARERDLIVEALRRAAGFVANEAQKGRNSGAIDPTEANIKRARVQEMRELAWLIENGIDS